MIIKIEFSDLNCVYYKREVSTSIEWLAQKTADLWTEGKAAAVKAGADLASLGVATWIDSQRVVPSALLSGKIKTYPKA